MTAASGTEDDNHVFDATGKMGLPGREWSGDVNAWPRGCPVGAQQAVGCQQMRKRHARQATRRLPEKLPSIPGAAVDEVVGVCGVCVHVLQSQLRNRSGAD